MSVVSYGLGLRTGSGPGTTLYYAVESISVVVDDADYGIGIANSEINVTVASQPLEVVIDTSAITVVIEDNTIGVEV